MNNQTLAKQKEYRMAVFGVISVLAFAVVIWQWVVTVRELDALAEGVGNYKFLRPYTDGEDLSGEGDSMEQKGMIKK